MGADDVAVADAPERNRYEVRVDGKLAGFAAYRKADDLIVFTHTEVDAAFGGRGIGAALVRQALDAVRAAGTARVVPLCPFVRAFIDRHNEYRDLLFTPPRSTARD